MHLPAITDKLEEVNFRWNFVVNAIDVSFFMLAMSIVSQTTIIPLLVAQLTPSKMAIGVIPAIQNLGFLLPQLFTASYVEGLRRKKPFIMWVSAIGERTPWLLAGFGVGAFARTSPVLTLVCIYLCIAISSVAGGLCTPAWYDMIAKVIPIRFRGLWSGVSFGLGAFMGIAGSALAGGILEKWSYPQSYTLLFMLAFVGLIISFVGLAFNRETDSETIKNHGGLANYLRQLPDVLRRNKNYRVFLVGRSIAYLSMMAGGFYIVYGAEKFHINGVEVGALSAMLVGSQSLMNVILGLLGDRKGHKIVLVLSMLAMGLAAMAAFLIPNQAVLWLVFFLLGTASAGETVSGLNIILEFCDPEERPTYIGLTNTILAPSRAIAALIGGWLASAWGYSPLFLVTMIMSLFSALLLGIWVKEPRKKVTV